MHSSDIIEILVTKRHFSIFIDNLCGVVGESACDARRLMMLSDFVAPVALFVADVALFVANVAIFVAYIEFS